MPSDPRDAPRRGVWPDDDLADEISGELPVRPRRGTPAAEDAVLPEPAGAGRRAWPGGTDAAAPSRLAASLGGSPPDVDSFGGDTAAIPRRARRAADAAPATPQTGPAEPPTAAGRRAVAPAEPPSVFAPTPQGAAAPEPAAAVGGTSRRSQSAGPDRFDIVLPPPLPKVDQPRLDEPDPPPAGAAGRRRRDPAVAARRGIGSRRSRRLPLIAALAGLVALLVGLGGYLVRSTATASGTLPATPPTTVPRAVSLAPGAGRPAELKDWLTSKGFSCIAEGTPGVEGYLCLLSGTAQTTVYVGGSASGLGRVTMMTPYDPSDISREVQDRLLTAALAGPAEVEAARSTLAAGSLENPASLTQGALGIKGSTGRQLVISVEGWPGRAAPPLGVSPAGFTDLARQAGYACTSQTGLVECTRAIGQMQLSLSGFVGVDELRYIRIRVIGTDRTVAQQALVSEATALLPRIGGDQLSEAFRAQAASGSPFAFSGAFLLDYYPAVASGNTVRTTLYAGQACWTGNALTC